MGRRTLLVALAGLAAVVAAGVVAVWPRPTRFTRAHCDRIQVGMSRAEVEAILGGRPGDYRTGPTTGASLTEAIHRLGPITYLGPRENWAPITFDRWQGDSGNVYVNFSPDGVEAKSFTATTKLEQRPLDNLLWRLKRQWHRWFR
jgi:hypothetical protein